MVFIDFRKSGGLYKLNQVNMFKHRDLRRFKKTNMGEMWFRQSSANRGVVARWDYYYPLVNIHSLLLKMAIEIVDLPIKNTVNGLHFRCFFSFLFVFSRFWGLMVFIGICSDLQLSSLICMVFVTFGVWIPQAGDILNTRDDENGNEIR